MSATNSQKGFNLGSIPEAPELPLADKKAWFDIQGFWIGMGVLFTLLGFAVIWGIQHLRYVYAKKKAQSALPQIELTPTSFSITGAPNAIEHFNSQQITQRETIQTWLTFRAAMPNGGLPTHPAQIIQRGRIIPRVDSSSSSHLTNTAPE